MKDEKVIILLGSNPSVSSPDDSPWNVSVRSSKILMSWIEGIDAEFVFLNVSDEKTKNNKSLSKAQVKDCIFSLKQKLDHYPNAKIIALGKTAEQALLMLKVENFLSIPHPSGLNRSLNDPETLRLTKENIKHFSS